MLCGSRHRSISRGSPALNKKPALWVTYPPPLCLAHVDPVSSRLELSILLCGSRQRSTSTGIPAMINKFTSWAALPSPPDLGLSGPPIFIKNRVVHHAVRFPSVQHVHREPCFDLQTYILNCPTLPP